MWKTVACNAVYTAGYTTALYACFHVGHATQTTYITSVERITQNPAVLALCKNAWLQGWDADMAHLDSISCRYSTDTWCDVNWDMPYKPGREHYAVAEARSGSSWWRPRDWLVMKQGHCAPAKASTPAPAPAPDDTATILSQPNPWHSCSSQLLLPAAMAAYIAPFAPVYGLGALTLLGAYGLGLATAKHLPDGATHIHIMVAASEDAALAAFVRAFNACQVKRLEDMYDLVTKEGS